MDLSLPPFIIKPQFSKDCVEWKLEHNARGVPMGVLLSHRPSDLLENCDLPPPLKLFSPKEITPQAPISMKDCRRSREMASNLADRANASLMRTLQLSQTRAREAEKGVVHAREANKQMAALLLEESMRLYAHRQWVKMLEVKVSLLKKKKKELKAWSREDIDEEPEAPAATWCLALALCLSIAGLGFALGRCMY